jgi:hypothetical protein
MVLSACPDIVDSAKGGISNWRDFLATAAVVRPMLGISPSAWEEARTVMGEAAAAVVVACLLQRSSTIQSAGGYLREFTGRLGRESSRSDPFSWPKLMPETANGDPPDGHGWLASSRGAVLGFRSTPGAEVSSDLVRSYHVLG